LPSEETTPPVTKMYLVGRALWSMVGQVLVAASMC
jgi:hypothetical protein